MRSSACRRAERHLSNSGAARAQWRQSALVVLCLTLFAVPARAEEREVVLHAIGARAEVGALAPVVQELLDRVAVRLHIVRASRFASQDLVSPSARVERALAAVWIDLQDAARARLYVYSPAQDRLLVRSVERGQASDEIVREEIAHIVHTAVEGLLSGAPVGLPRTEVLPTLAAATPELPVRRTRAQSDVSVWQLRGGYRGALLASDVLSHGPLAELALRPLDLALRPGLLLSAHYAWPVRASTRSAGAELQSSEIRLLASVQQALSRRWTVRPMLGAGLDWVRVRPFSDRRDVQPAESSGLVLAALRAALELEVSVLKRVAIHAAISTDLQPGGTRYVLVRRAGDEEVLSPWLVRPGVSLGLAWP
jgi:hypothetical protein